MAVIAVHTSNNRISSINNNATVAPPDTAELFYIVLNDTEFADLRDLGEQAKADGLSPSQAITWDGNAFVLAPDTRPFVRISSSIAGVQMDADGVIAVPAQLTIQALNPDGTDNNGVNNTLDAVIFNRLMRLTFVNGEAIKDFKPTATGVIRTGSNNETRLQAELELTVVEV